jgi:hypothetical protein
VDADEGVGNALAAAVGRSATTRTSRPDVPLPGLMKDNPIKTFGGEV